MPEGTYVLLFNKHHAWPEINFNLVLQKLHISTPTQSLQSIEELSTLSMVDELNLNQESIEMLCVIPTSRQYDYFTILNSYTQIIKSYNAVSDK